MKPFGSSIINSAIRLLVYFTALLHQPSTSSCSGSLGNMVLLRGTSRRCVDCSLFCRLDSFLQGTAHWNKR
ncbi:hypothetical protein MTR67_018742 [Solanum verrucosum]|uniref:Secreted protein n=1 Tax=Solanum verrucosum TaxID=315347 RepID=A0AAF0TLU4_SOLVR|nr:hypothetical protein MTR67_018742 [Solanum verrucosum]